MFAVEWLMVLLLAEIQMKRTSVFLLFEPTVYYAVVAPFFFLDAKSLLCCVAFLFTFKRHFTYTITYNLSYRQEFQNITSWRIHLKYFLSLRSRMATYRMQLFLLCCVWTDWFKIVRPSPRLGFCDRSIVWGFLIGYSRATTLPLVHLWQESAHLK